jgi:hypothetical protein
LAGANFALPCTFFAEVSFFSPRFSWHSRSIHHQPLARLLKIIIIPVASNGIPADEDLTLWQME